MRGGGGEGGGGGGGEVRRAAAGVGSQVAWQVWSRALAFAVKAVAVRAVGPRSFAYTEIRLGLLAAACAPVAEAARSVALRAEADDAAAGLLLCSAAATVALAAAVGAVAAWADPAHAGPIVVTVVGVALGGVQERARVFAVRRERHEALQRARAVARVAGGAVTSASVLVLPEALVGGYAVVVGNAAQALVLLLAMRRAAGGGVPRVGPRAVAAVVTRDDVKMLAIETWQRVFKTVLSNGESLVLDLTCVDPMKGAYKLAANVASMLARFFSEALEEQSFNLFSRLAWAFRVEGAAAGGRACGAEARGDATAAEVRAQCVTFLHMSVKLALLVSLLMAFVGPCFAYSFLLLLYGRRWADETPAPQLLGLYFVYLVFMAANGVTEALLAATASTKRRQAQSVFSVALSGLYMAALFAAGRAYAARGIIAVNCANMAARTLYSVVYYTDLTGLPAATLIRGAAPAKQVVAALAVARAACAWSERRFVAGGVPAHTHGMLLAIAQHAVSGALSVALFLAAVYVYERPLRSYMRMLRGGGGEAAAKNKEL